MPQALHRPAPADLLRVYALDFLVDAIEHTQARCHQRIVHAIAAPAPRLAA